MAGMAGCRKGEKHYRCRGSHRTERQIKMLLARDPQIHDGGTPRGCFCLCITEGEAEFLNNNDIKVTLDKRFVR